MALFAHRAFCATNRTGFGSVNTVAPHAYAYVPKTSLRFLVQETTSVQYSRVFHSDLDLFLQANTNVTVAVSRFGSVSRESKVSGVFNLEAQFSRMER